PRGPERFLTRFGGPSPNFVMSSPNCVQHHINITTASLYNSTKPRRTMETSTSPLSSIRSMSDPPAFNSPSPSSELQANTNTGTRRERRNGKEKLDLVWRYIVDEMNWSIGDFVHTLCTSDGQANARRKTAFA